LHSIAYCQSYRLLILLLQAETEIHILTTDGMFKMKIKVDRCGSRLPPNTRQHFDPPYFSFPTTLENVKFCPLLMRTASYPYVAENNLT